MTWTPDQIDTLKAMWAKGHSASQIGRVIRKTRNAVTGKIDRLGLPLRGEAARPIRLKPKFAPQAVRNALFGGPKLTTVRASLIPLLDLKTGDCRWPIGEPRDAGFGFCGCSQAAGSSYCPEHTLASANHQQAALRKTLAEFEKEAA